jgi:ppGpp synthetase/RelA/SpoT-type nucleotidyltranferase
MEKPDSITKYREWIAKTLAVQCDQRLEAYYNAVTTKLRDDFSRSDFWQKLISRTEEFAQEYQVKTSYPLFALPPLSTQISIKPFNSFVEKTYRKNIIHNQNWPVGPDGGWFNPQNCFHRINDVLRTTYAVKYIDGVDFLFLKLSDLAEEMNLPSTVDYEARDEGYYAGHFTVRIDLAIPRQDWDVETINIAVEIQITTQLQEVIRRLLHKYYEHRRLSAAKPSRPWQWEYSSADFTANYLGHILHYIEGTILEVRDKKTKESI